MLGAIISWSSPYCLRSHCILYLNSCPHHPPTSSFVLFFPNLSKILGLLTDQMTRLHYSFLNWSSSYCESREHSGSASHTQWGVWDPSIRLSYLKTLVLKGSCIAFHWPFHWKNKPHCNKSICVITPYSCWKILLFSANFKKKQVLEIILYFLL